MLTVLSALDERARPKGSRDPLGVETIWSHVGRQVVGNLTTVTSNLENFMVALLCCHFASESATELQDIQSSFMRGEQVAAYLKLVDAKRLLPFLGITRAKKNFESSEMVLGESARAQILSDQLSYGLWGLYSSALEGAALIEGPKRKLTLAGTALVGHAINTLGGHHWDRFAKIARQSAIRQDDLATIAAPFSAMLRNPKLRHQFVDALLAQQRNCALQSELYRLAQVYLDDKGRPAPQAFCIWILRSEDASGRMKQAFRRMQDLEPLLVAADVIMAWLQQQAHSSLNELAEEVGTRLPGMSIQDSWIEDLALPHRQYLMRLRDAINSGNGAALIKAIVDQNKLVMSHRGGAAWIEFDHRDILTVRVRNEGGMLPIDLAAECCEWRNTYFLYSFLFITSQGRA